MTTETYIKDAPEWNPKHGPAEISSPLSLQGAQSFLNKQDAQVFLEKAEQIKQNSLAGNPLETKTGTGYGTPDIYTNLSGYGDKDAKNPTAKAALQLVQLEYNNAQIDGGMTPENLGKIRNNVKNMANTIATVGYEKMSLSNPEVADSVNQQFNAAVDEAKRTQSQNNELSH